jgi:hypothetical protein
MTTENTEHTEPRPAQRDSLCIGKFSLRNYAPGKFWLENTCGEGMETSEAKIEELLSGLFKREY